MNGSLAAGNCSDIDSVGNSTVCRQPTSSVLFDGTIPILTGLSSNSPTYGPARYSQQRL